jgi:hypothetical protein
VRPPVADEQEQQAHDEEADGEAEQRAEVIIGMTTLW